MRRAFDRLYGKIKPGSVALIFFSGYGVQSSRQSYMIPVDAQIWTEPDVRRDGFSLETVLGEINSRGAGVKIALIDASRRNPFERRFRSFSAGLAPVIAPNGTLVMYSAALSSVVSDNGSDRSLFVKELLKEIRTPDLMAEETLNRTRVGVTRASRVRNRYRGFRPRSPRISPSSPSGSGPRPGSQPSTPVATAPADAPRFRLLRHHRHPRRWRHQPATATPSGRSTCPTVRPRRWQHRASAAVPRRSKPAESAHSAAGKADRRSRARSTIRPSRA